MSLGTSVPEGADVVVTEPGAPSPGGVTFDPKRPGDLIEQIRAFLSVPSWGPVVVTSACGGSGVTSVALHLAAAFASTAGEAYVVESHSRCGVLERLGLDRNELPTWGGMQDGDGVDGAVVSAPNGLRLLAAPSGTASCGAAVSAGTGRGVTVVDAAPSVLDDLGLSRGRVVVMLPPSIPAAHRTRALLGARPDLTWAVVVNRLGRGGETNRARLAAVLGVAPTLELPCTPSLRDAEDLGRLLHERRTRFARRVGVLATALGSP